ncbi:MAG: Mov34/MPN/PAD-1 family protein [Kofleriaceae bacterium]
MSSLDVRSIDEKGLRHKPVPSTKQAFRVFLSEQAFDRAVARGDSDTTREIGGVLVGEVLKDDAGPYLWIDGTVDALHAEEKGAELTFTHATWDHIHKEMDSKHQNKRVVGWYHTHPGFGVFLSDRDQFIHKSFFNLPFQVALVYDPKTHEHGLFTWHDNEVWRARRYWIGPREHIWDGPRASTDGPDRKPAEPAAGAPAAKVAADGRDDWSLGGARGPLLVTAVLVLLIGGFAGHWLGVGSANQALGEAQIEIAKGRADGASTMASTLQRDLVGVLRDTLGDEALRRPLAQAVAELDRAMSLMSAGSPELASQLKATRDSLLQLSQSRGTAQAELAQLERLARPGSELRADLGRDVAEQRAGIGALYAELATTALKLGDPARARRLLAAAAHFDPRNRARYETQLRSFDTSATLPVDLNDNTGAAGEGTIR